MSVATASTAAPAKASRLSVFWESQVGKKVVSAVTGILLFLFVVGHLLGNLQAFQGAGKFNAYAQFLQNTKGLIWTTRIVMLAAVVLHATAGIQLYLKARAARPQPYRVPLANPATVSSKTMIWSGLLILAFVVYHLLDLTLGVAFVHSGFVHGDAYLNLVNTFRSTGKVIFYGVSVIGLGLHLSHGLYSLWQSLGFRAPLWTPTIAKAALVLGVVLALGYLLIPAGVVAGLIRL
ncbi:MAG TPA: succinate dehydrogenase cytochrome b subunit [Anaeromyxobacteraceae bacterium]|nr:succinate dehydrogenase cytochrome b subunit [Anaeromyxobacteraceae bacterium]